MLERLQKIISAAGVTSRRAAEELIAEGRVRVNGTVVTELGSKADAGKDHIKVDGKLINPHQPLTYVMLNKPAGFVTTMSDPEGRPTVHDLLKGIKTRVYPVGRLDYNTEGLLLLTNDGDFAHLITHPKHEFPKTYLAKVKGVLEERQIEMLEKGMFLQDGKTAPARVRKIRKEEANSWVEITIHEGRKRQVRRMFDHVGRSVIKLKRTKTGSLSLGDLPEGTFRHLTLDEVNALRETAMKTDDSGQQVRVYKPAEISKGEARTTSAVPQETGGRGREMAPRGRSARPVMHDTRSGRRSNQRNRAVQRVRPATEGFIPRETRSEGPASRPASGRPAPGRYGSKPAFGRSAGFSRGETRSEGPSSRPSSGRPAPGRYGSKPAFGRSAGFSRGETRSEGPSLRPASGRPAPRRDGSKPAFGRSAGFSRGSTRSEGPASRPASGRPAPRRDGSKPAFGRAAGFRPRETGGEGPARSASRRPAPGRPGQKASFGSQGPGRRTESAGWRPASGPRANKSKYTGGKGQGTRSGPGRGGARGAGSRGPRR